MKMDQLKTLIKGIVKEIRRRRIVIRDEYELEDVEIDGQTIPKIITPQHMLKFNIMVEYAASPGCPGKYYGRPEDCYPAEGPEVEILNSYMTSLAISAPKSQDYVEINLDRLRRKFPQMYQAFNKIARDYVDQNQEKIEEKILETLDDSSFEPDYDDRDD